MNVTCSVVCLSVCLCIGYTGGLCKNGRTDREPVWRANSCGPKKPYFSWGSTLVPPEEYDGMIFATAAIHAVANVTVANLFNRFP